jgi:hypothetical protein
MRSLESGIKDSRLKYDYHLTPLISLSGVSVGAQHWMLSMEFWAVYGYFDYFCDPLTGF